MLKYNIFCKKKSCKEKKGIAHMLLKQKVTQSKYIIVKIYLLHKGV